MTRLLRLVCPILSTGLLASGITRVHSTWLTAGILMFGVLWILGLARGWSWMPMLALFVVFGTAAAGILLKTSSIQMLVSALLGFLAWDLAEFAARLRQAAPEDDTSRIERTHLVRMAVLMVTSSLLCTLALVVRIRLSFEVLVLLIFLSLWGIGQAVNWFQGTDH